MKPLLFILAAALLFASCSRPSENELLSDADDAFQQGNFTLAIEKYEELLTRYPWGQHSEHAQFQIAYAYNHGLHDYPKAIEAYRKFYSDFPKSPNAPKALFLVGFIFNNELADYDSARAAYEEFIRRYPEDEMVPSAKFEIATMGKDLEELFRTEVAAQDAARKEKQKKK